MPSIRTVEVPSGPLLAWALANQGEIETAMRSLNALLEMRYTLATPGGGGTSAALVLSDTEAALVVPLKLPNSYAAPTGTPARTTFNADESTTASGSYTQAEVQAINDRLTATRRVLAALINDFQTTGQIPKV
jgi:hypothetical protein